MDTNSALRLELPPGSAVQGTVLPSLNTACHSGNPLKASFAINRGRVRIVPFD